MTLLPFRRARLGTAAVLGLSVAAACSDSTTAPSSPSSLRPSSAPAFARSGSATSNGTKYSDHGAKPATGRSGTAAIMSRVLIGADGNARIEITTGDFDIAGSAKGDIVHLQTKISDQTGEKVDTEIRNRLSGSTISFVRAGVGRGYRFQFQANVRGIDGKRTDVVTVEDVVRLAPDPTILRVSAPAEVHAGEVVPITATIKELNGDVGARSDCVLYVDGVAVDRSTGIWVDAGDVVTCAFATRFSSLGTRQIRVTLEAISPADFNATNNSASASVKVVPLTVLMGFAAEAFQQIGTYHNNYLYQYADGPSGAGYASDFRLDYSEDTRWQFARIHAWIDQPVEFPLTKVEVSQSADGVAIDAQTLTSLASGTPFGTTADGGVCAERGGNGNSLVICTYHRGTSRWSTAYYDRNAGVVTYTSYQLATFTAPWGSGIYDAPSWTYNANTWGPSVTPFGRTVAVSVRIASGTNVFVADATIPLVANDYTTGSNTCSTTPSGAGTVRQCYDIKGDYKELAGTSAGVSAGSTRH